MSNNYDDYGYENNHRKDSSSLIRRILIVFMILLAIFLIFYLLKGCSSGKIKTNNVVEKPKFDYENALLEAGKTYFERNLEENPKSIGECNIVELQKLIDNKLVDSNNFGNCNVTTSYLRVCILENGVKQYTPWLVCTNQNSEKDYQALKEGNISEVIANKTYTEFKFLPQVLKKGEAILGNVEEIWKDDIKYNSYKTLATTTYYRFRDKLYTWELSKRNYYTSTGDKTNSSEVKEYYATSPKNGYNLSSDKTTEAYKWYTTTSEKEYYTVNGAKMPSSNAVGSYTIKDPQGIDITRYRSRNITGTYNPTLYYVCSTNASSPYVIYQPVKCGQGTNKQYVYQRQTVYSCANPSETGESIKGQIVSNSSVKCNKYSSWSSVTTTPCDTSKTNICQSVTVTLYYWYRVKNDIRTYYPSGSKTSSGEKVYYTTSPIKDAIKDEQTKSTAYKWYNESTSTSSSYTAIAPAGYTTAKKSKQYMWSDWSDWSVKNPKIKDGRDRSIETKIKVKLQENKGTTNDSWENISDTYLTEEQLIKTYQEKKYDVKTLEDITNNGEIKYLIKMYVRNKKESK